jgi:hypothetical protein
LPVLTKSTTGKISLHLFIESGPEFCRRGNIHLHRQAVVLLHQELWKSRQAT